MSDMLITMCVIAYNEEQNINGILECIKNQDYDHNNMEVVLVDGASTDNTRALMCEFALDNKDEFRRVVVLDNPKKTLPSGWNVALREYKGDAIIKVDAHAVIPEDFVSKNVRVLETGEYICGGQRPNIIDKPTPFKETLLLAESSMFGSSIASYRNNPGKTYVKSLFHAAYRREVFDKIGFYNEELGRTEDNEIHYRMRKAGFKLCYCPEIVSYQHTRNTLKGMLKQKYGNGYWVALTLKACPECLAIYHFVPFAFVGGIVVTSALAVCHHSLLAKLMWGAYSCLAILMSFMAVKGQKKYWQQLLLPILFFLLHVSYGIGSVVGFLKLPFWKYEKRTGV